MNIRQIQVSVRRLVAGPVGGLGKFENVTFECTLEATLGTTDNVHEAYDALMKICKSKVNQELDRLEGVAVSTPVEEDYIPSDGGFKPTATKAPRK